MQILRGLASPGIQPFNAGGEREQRREFERVSPGICGAKSLFSGDDRGGGGAKRSGDRVIGTSGDRHRQECLCHTGVVGNQRAGGRRRSTRESR